MTQMKSLPTLVPGDTVEIIAPASGCAPERLQHLYDLLLTWHLNPVIDNDIFGPDIICANNDEARFRTLANCLTNPVNKAVICVRGGYGSMRLIPKLRELQPPSTPKILVGMSDITALQLFLMQAWQWPVIHGSAAMDIFSEKSVNALKTMLFGEIEKISLAALACNEQAKHHKTICASLTGGNLSLLQTSVGTAWQLAGAEKIILIEEVGERGYRVDRMLEHLRQAGIFEGALAIVLADFINGKEPNGTTKIPDVLERFAHTIEIPVVQIQGVGHGHENHPLPLGTKAILKLGSAVELIVIPRNVLCEKGSSAKSSVLSGDPSS